jgi:hypothetical protein
MDPLPYLSKRWFIATFFLGAMLLVALSEVFSIPPIVMKWIVYGVGILVLVIVGRSSRLGCVISACLMILIAYSIFS